MKIELEVPNFAHTFSQYPTLVVDAYGDTRVILAVSDDENDPEKFKGVILNALEYHNPVGKFGSFFKEDYMKFDGKIILQND